MKLQKVLAYKYKDAVRYKYLVALPEEIVMRLGWKPGCELKGDVDRGNLILTYVSDPMGDPKEDPMPTMTYDEFKRMIQNELKANPEGLTWRELRERLKLPQTVPNNKWVHQLERDIGLLRIKHIRGIVWRLK